MDLKDITIKKSQHIDLTAVIEQYGYTLENLSHNVLALHSENAVIFLELSEDRLYFQKDLGSLKNVSNEKLWFDLLDLNTEIVPVSVGIDTENNHSRLVLVESMVASTADVEEIFNVLDSLEYAEDKTTALLKKHLQNRK